MDGILTESQKALQPLLWLTYAGCAAFDLLGKYYLSIAKGIKIAIAHENRW